MQLRHFPLLHRLGRCERPVATEKELHTSQPPLNRQIRDLEQEVGVPRVNHGADSNAGGQNVPDQACMERLQAEAASKAALRQDVGRKQAIG